MFKDKKFARRLALVLCLSLVVGILPVGVLNAPVQINAVSDNLVVDGSFEEGKWNTGTALILVDDAATGAKSMQMNAGKGGVGTTQLIDAAISAFEVYELSFMYKHAIGRAPYIGVWFFKDEADNDHFVDASVVYPADQSGEWVKVTYEVVVPEGANIAQLQIGYNSDSKSEDPTSACQIDDLSLVKVRKYAFVEKFEDLKGMASKGWTASNNFSGSAVSNYANYYQGTKSLFLQAGGAWTKSPAIAVTAGNTYTAEFYAMKSSANSGRSDGVQLVFLDKNGAELDKVEMTLSIVNNEWKKQTLTGIAPAGAVSAQLVYTLGSASGDYGIDDLYVSEIAASNPDETKPSEPETVPSEPATEPSEEATVIFSDNFEVGTLAERWDRTHPHIQYWSANGDGKPEFHYEGNGVLLLQDYTDSLGHTITSKAITAVPGNAYTLTYQVRDHWAAIGDSVGTVVKMYFVDASGNELTDATVTAPAITSDGTDWAEVVVNATAPAGAVSLHVAFTTPVESKNVICAIDALTVAETAGTAPEATEPSTEATEPSTEASEPADLPIYSNDFDGEYTTTAWVNSSNGRNYTNELPKDWTAFEYEQITISLIKGQWGAKDGKMLFLQVNKDKWTRSDAIPAVAGATYTITYDEMDYIAGTDNNYGGYAAAIFVDADGKELAVIKNEIKKDTAAQVWSEASFEAVAPEGAVALHIEFGIKNGAGNPEFGVDNLKVYMTEGAAPEETVPSEPETVPSEPAGNLVFSDKFEEHDNYDYTNTQGKPATNAIPKGWTSYDPHNIRAACNNKYFDVYEGYNLFFQEAKGDKWVKSPLFDVVAGNTYTANFMDIKMPGTIGTGAYAAIVFVDANGAVLATQTAAAGLANTWGANSVVATAPSGAVAAYVEFGLKSATGNPEFAVDNLEVYMTEGAAPEVTEPSTEPSEPALDGVIPNGGFEDGKNGWRGGAAVEISDSDVYAGNYAAVIPATEASVFMQSEKIPAVPGQTYYLSVMAKRLSGDKEAYIGFWYVDANGAYVGEGATVVRFADDAWTEYTLEWTVPEGVAYFWVEWGVNSKANSSFVFDNIVVTDAPYVPEGPTEPATKPSEPATEPTEAPIFTDTFENAYTPDGAGKTVHIPVGWTPSVLSAAIGTAGYDKYDGTENLCVQDPKNKDIKSPLIEVIPGYEYAAKYVEKKYQPNVAGNGGYVKIVFVDATGAILKEYSQIAGQSAEWTNKTLLSKAPAGATHMYVEFGLLNPTGEPTYSVDNLAVYAYEAELGDAEPTMPTEPIPTEPEGTNVMFGDKFETLADATTGNAGPLGWISSDDANGAYSAAISVGTFGIENDGNFLCLQTPGQWSIRSSKFAAKAGYEYEIKFLARKLVDNANYTGALKIVFLDAYGNVTGDFTETVGKTFGAWTAESVKAVAPNGTVAAYLEFSLDNADRKTKGDYGIDDLEVIKSDEPVFVPEEPTEPGEGNTGTGDSVVLLPVFGVMAAVVALAVLVIKKRRFF